MGNMKLLEKPNENIVEKVLEKHQPKREDLLPILVELNQLLGYLPKEVLELVSEKMKLPKSHILSTATFYSMLSTKEHGQHVIQFCESAPCHIVGGKELLEALKERLQIEPGETTEDGKWTLLTTSCIGLCSMGPVLLIDEDLYGHVTPSRLVEIMDHYE